MILAYRKSGVLQAVTVVRENPKSTTVKLVGEPNRPPLRVPKNSVDMRLFGCVDGACDYVRGVCHE